MSGGGSSSGKCVDRGRGKGGGRDLLLCGRVLLGLISSRRQRMSFQFRTKASSPKRLLSEYTITIEKIGQNATMVRIA